MCGIYSVEIKEVAAAGFEPATNEKVKRGVVQVLGCRQQLHLQNDG
jgi:hypothetical protein